MGRRAAPGGPGGPAERHRPGRHRRLRGREHPDVAADFLAWFTNPENAETLAAYFPPPRESLLTAETLGAANPKLSEEQLQAVVVDGIQGAVTKPSHQNFAKLQDTVRSQLDALWTADADVEGVLADTCAAIQPLLGD